MEQLLTILIFGILIEGFVSYLTEIYNEKGFKWKQLVAMFIGIVLSIIYKIDFLSVLGIARENSILMVNFIITGIIISRGSNYIFDIFKLIKGAKDKILDGVD